MQPLTRAALLVASLVGLPRFAFAADESPGLGHPATLRFAPLGLELAAAAPPGEDDSPHASPSFTAPHVEVERPPSRFSIVAMLVGGALLAGDGLLSIGFALYDFLGPVGCPTSICGSHARAVQNVLGTYSIVTGVVAEGFGIGLLIAGMRRRQRRNEFYSAPRVSLAILPIAGRPIAAVGFRF